MLQPGLDKENIMHFKSKYTRGPSRIASLDIETVSPSLQKGFPPYPTHVAKVASILTADQVAYGEWRFAIESVTFCDERAAIERIDELLAGRKCLTYNGKGFDLPVLGLVAMRASAFGCRNITEAWASPRFGGSHIDLADLISNFGSAPKVSLEMLCDAAAVPVKTNGHGCDVEHMLATQGIEAVKRYCEEDTCSTISLFALVQGLHGNDPAYGSSLIGDLVNWISDSGLVHLDDFRKMLGNPVRERNRLLHRVSEGIRDLEERATMAFFDEKPLAF
jgi:DNA polymerase elongation subunit (family B)